MANRVFVTQNITKLKMHYVPVEKKYTALKSERAYFRSPRIGWSKYSKYPPHPFRFVRFPKSPNSMKSSPETAIYFDYFSNARNNSRKFDSIKQQLAELESAADI